MDKCAPCNTLWMESKNDELESAIYDQMCTSGEFKSAGVIIGTILFILVIGIICCCQNRVIAKKLRVIELKSQKTKRTAEEAMMANKIGAVLGMKIKDEMEFENLQKR